jgi:hypothetical protein
MAIDFAQVKEYLNLIASKGANPAGSRHGVFWDVNYDAFITGLVPNKHCLGQNVPIIDPVDKKNSAFYQILKGRWCSMPQMPLGGPHVTEADYTVTLASGAVITGTQVLQDIEDWLAAGAPEH